MVKLLNGIKTPFYNYFYLFCIIIYAGSATEFTRSLGNLLALGNFVAIILTIIFCVINRVRFQKSYWLSLLVFTTYAVATFINNGVISPMWLTQWYIWLTIAYIICHVFKHTFLIAYESIIYKLSVIGLVIWGLYILYPSAMLSLAKSIHFSNTYHEALDTFNIIVYTFLPDRNNDFVLLERNFGFAWEPGAYSCFLFLAIFCNILRTKMKFKKNTSLIVLLMALLTTQSTTGYIIFIVMMLLWILSTKKKYYAFILIPLLVLLFQLPFVQDKLLEEFYNIETINLNNYNDNESHSLGRLISFQLDFEEFLRHPILGLGGYTQGTWLYQQGYDNIATISGIGKLLSRFGGIMTIVFLILLGKSARLYAKRYHSMNGYIILIVILGSMISYDLWRTPCFICFWICGIYTHTDKRQYINEKI